MQLTPSNEVWKQKLNQCFDDFDVISQPRGMEVREIINGHYTVKMPGFLDLVEREVKTSFMLAEAAWIISGSNRLSDLFPYMKVYANFSDDGVFLRGAYGPKVVDQLPYIVDSIINDNDTRQAVMTIWRERPSSSKDIPCTVAAQFLVRDSGLGGKKSLHMVTTMRSNDIVLGFTYDVFSFSMIANAVRLLLKERGLDVELGNLHVNAGSLHLYQRHYKDIARWSIAKDRDENVVKYIEEVMKAETYQDLIDTLKDMAHDAKANDGIFEGETNE